MFVFARGPVPNEQVISGGNAVDCNSGVLMDATHSIKNVSSLREVSFVREHTKPRNIIGHRPAEQCIFSQLRGHLIPRGPSSEICLHLHDRSWDVWGNDRQLTIAEERGFLWSENKEI